MTAQYPHGFETGSGPEVFAGAHEKMTGQRGELQKIEDAIAAGSPELSAPEVTAELDTYLIDKAEDVLSHADDPGFKDRILEAASLIAIEGTDEYNGKPSAGENPITVWELADHGDLLYDVVDSYNQAGATDDAETIARAIDGLAHKQDGQGETETNVEKIHGSKLKATIGKAALFMAGMKPVIGEFGGVVTAKTNEQQAAYKEDLKLKHGWFSQTYVDHYADADAFKEWKKTGELPETPELITGVPNFLPPAPVEAAASLAETSAAPVIDTIPSSFAFSSPEKSQMKQPTHSKEKFISLEKPFKNPFLLPEAAKNNVLAAPLSPTLEQNLAERTYDIAIGPAAAQESLTVEDIARRLEVDHVVKEAPYLAGQVQEKDRTNPITSVAWGKEALYTQTSAARYAKYRQAHTEHDVLHDLQDYLENAQSADAAIGPELSEKAKAMTDALTFIGKKEYVEATTGIAEYWKNCLETNPDLQIYAIIGKIAHGDTLKSDTYLLDTILGNFTDEETKKYAGRLITESDDVKATDPSNLKAVLLDDWTISGSQLKTARTRFLSEHKGFESSVEVQLVAANKDRVTKGLEYGTLKSPQDGRLSTPVRAYYLAHKSDHAEFGAHITGFHSTVDYDVESVWSDMTHIANTLQNKLDYRQQRLTVMPLAANIVRPYRTEGYKPVNKTRLEMYNNRKRKEK